MQQKKKINCIKCIIHAHVHIHSTLQTTGSTSQIWSQVGWSCGRRVNCSIQFNKKDLNIWGFWYLQGSWKQSPDNIKGQLCLQNAAAAKSLYSCSTPFDPIDCSPLGSYVHGILQERILEWAAMSSSRGSFWPRDWTHVSYVFCTGRQILYHWASWEAHKMLKPMCLFFFFN